MTENQSADLIVVTGSGGMGTAIARRVGSGRRILLADRSPEALEAARTSLAEDGIDTVTRVVDVGDPAEVEELAATADELGGFLHLVHTAGVSPSQADPEQIVRVDVVGTALLLDAFGMRVGPGGAGVVVASMAGAMLPVDADVEAAMATTPTDRLAELPVFATEELDPGHAYSLAKRANQLRVRSAALDWGRRGGRVVSISPGVIQTPMGRQELASPVGDMMRQMVEGSPTGRLGTPWDIAAVTAFLLSPEASFVTGCDLLVDGGVVASVLTPRPDGG